MRRFRIERTTDITGISGTGVILYGIEWVPDGPCDVYWLRTETTGQYPSLDIVKSALLQRQCPRGIRGCRAFTVPMMSFFEAASFAVTLKARRGARSLREVARESGVSASTLSRLENGEAPDMETALRVCTWLQVAPSTFLKGEQGDEAHAPHDVYPPGNLRHVICCYLLWEKLYVKAGSNWRH